MEIKDHFFDTRTMKRYIKKGVIKKKDYDTYLKKLDDSTDNMEYIVLEDDTVLDEEIQEEENQVL